MALTLLRATSWRKWPVGMDLQDQFLQGAHTPRSCLPGAPAPKPRSCDPESL